ncbi:hypothetical protein, partial [Streptomyces californicus]|uniref:hypothetical protein n=1 Tax=Streptomyces californicus TaxID=67351 RepID=UPI0033C6E634
HDAEVATEKYNGAKERADAATRAVDALTDEAPPVPPSAPPRGADTREGPPAADATGGPSGRRSRYIFLSMPSISSTVASAKV